MNNIESLKQRILALYRLIAREARRWTLSSGTRLICLKQKKSPLLTYRPTPLEQHWLTQNSKPDTKFNFTYLGFLGMAINIPTNLNWELMGLLSIGTGITVFLINSKMKRSFNSFSNQFKAMLLAAQDILKKSDDSKEIKGVKNQVEEIKQSLEIAFKSENTSIPKESFVDFLTGYDLYIKAESTSSLKERAESLEMLQSLLENFRIKYKDFILGEVDDYLIQLEAWTKISLNILLAKGLALNASLEPDETKQLYKFYFGILQYLEIVEDCLDFFTERGRDLAKRIAHEIINHKPFENLANRKLKNIDEKANIAISLRNAAKAILWEVEIHERNNRSKSSIIPKTTIDFTKKSPGWINDDFEKYSINDTANQEKIKRSQSSKFRPSSGRSLERHIGSWVGNDIEECLQKVHDTRSTF